MIAFLWIFVLFYSLSAIIYLKCYFVSSSIQIQSFMVLGKVENEIIMTPWNGLHKFPIAISGKTPKPLRVFDLRHQKWSGYGPQNKRTSEHIWQPEKGLVISSYPFLLPTTNSIKMKLNFWMIFDNHLSKFFSK